MAFNYFPTGYQSVAPQAYAPQGNSFQNGTGSNLIWVQGEAGAKSYLVAPNQTVVLWDSEQNSIYLKSADASGMPSIKILDYTIRNEMPQKADISAQKDFATKDDVEYLKKEINALKSKFGDRKEAKK